MGRVHVGSLVRVPFGGRVVRGFVLGLSTATSDDLETIKGVVIETPLVPPPMDEVMGEVAARYVVPRGRAFARVVPPRVRTKSVVAEFVAAPPTPMRIPSYEGGRELLAALSRRTPGTWCIQVVPGEDRGRLISEMTGVLPDGATLVLVPEVRYGSLVLDSVAGYFPSMARVDSAQDETDRSSAWLAMAGGHRVGGGGRGAIFTPAPDLALIVIDEEHHQTYKEDRAPRYDARWVARCRGRAQGAAVVFLSASPSVETGSAAANGAYGSVVASRSDRRAARPLVELVDRPEDRSIGHELHERIASTLRDGSKVALLAPSPAFARAVWCGGCRRSLRCPRCESGLFFDRSARRVRCTRCGLTDQAPETCPTCGAADFKYVGAGTERLAEQLARSFPRAAVHRVDPNHPSGAPAGGIDIYLTTWMGTKPALRPDVSLVGVLDADWLIRRPDFRASESAYQAMVEMAEWAGPASGGGRLVVQTLEPNHHALQAVVRADYDFFLRRELEFRRELGYPPFVEIVKVTMWGPEAEALAQRVSDEVTPITTRVLGPVEIKGSEGELALQLLIKCHDSGPVAKSLRVILESLPKGVRMSVDVDPR